MSPLHKPTKTDCGAIIPLVTPITGEGKLDEPALRRLIDKVITGGVQGIFVLGSTGEGPSTPRAMRPRIVQIAVEQAAGKVRVYAGTSDTVVHDSITAAAEYLRMGVRAVVVQLPLYYTLTPDEQFNYFSTLVRRIPGPVLLYDIPEAVHGKIEPRVVEHLRAFDSVVGIKDSSGDPEQLKDLLDAYADDPAFSVLTGSVALASYGFEYGADGFVPSTGNLEPELCARLFAAAETGDRALMDELQRDLDALTDQFRGPRSLGQGIARLKAIMSKRGLCGPSVFLPLTEASV